MASGFDNRTEIASWINTVFLVSTVVLLLSFAILPPKWTHRHHLSICLAIGIGFMELAFLVPLAASPEQCFNEITPNDMTTNGTCAVSGAFLLFGGWATVIWVFCRALSLHLQICWEVMPGQTFFYTTLGLGWAIPAVGLALALSLTGVSYRFGNVCHINHKNGLQAFWGPLMAFSAAALILQFITLGYCIQVYIRSLMHDKPETENSSGPPSFSGSVRTASARQAYKRVKRVIQLQWRGVAIVILVIAIVIFFSIVFVSMDSNAQIDADTLEKTIPWLACLPNNSVKECLPLLARTGLVQSEGTVLAVLIMLGVSFRKTSITIYQLTYSRLLVSGI